MTSLTLSYIAIIIPIAFFILPCWEMIRDNDSNKRGLRKITKLGWTMVVFAFIAGALLFLIIYIQNKEKIKADKNGENIRIADKRHYDSTRLADKKDYKDEVDTALKKYGLHTVQGSKTVTIVDTTKNNIDPILDAVIYSDKPNPYFDRNESKRADSIQFNIDIGSINKGIANNIRDNLILFTIRNGVFNQNYVSGRITNESLKSNNYQGLHVYAALTLNSIPFIDTVYIYFKEIYSNRPIKGIDQPPLQKLYYVIIPANSKTIKDLGKIKEIENQNRYLYLKDFLLKKNYW